MCEKMTQAETPKDIRLLAEDLWSYVQYSFDCTGFLERPRGSHAMITLGNKRAWQLHDLLVALCAPVVSQVETTVPYGWTIESPLIGMQQMYRPSCSRGDAEVLERIGKDSRFRLVPLYDTPVVPGPALPQEADSMLAEAMGRVYGANWRAAFERFETEDNAPPWHPGENGRKWLLGYAEHFESLAHASGSGAEGWAEGMRQAADYLRAEIVQ